MVLCTFVNTEGHHCQRSNIAPAMKAVKFTNTLQQYLVDTHVFLNNSSQPQNITHLIFPAADAQTSV